MHAARGILRAREEDEPPRLSREDGANRVVGCDSMRVDETGKTVTFEGCVSKTREGDVLSVDETAR